MRAARGELRGVPGLHHDLSVIELSSIKDRHSGRCIAVLGGGPTLLADLRRLPEDCLLVGVNQHTMLLNLDYLVFQDREIYPVVQESDAPLCTHHRDLAQIYTGIVPDFGLSGATAVWMAEYLGASQIIVCGCDNYTAGRRYWHSKPNQMSAADGYSGIEVWHQVRRLMARPEAVRVMSGPLCEVFKSYES